MAMGSAARGGASRRFAGGGALAGVGSAALAGLFFGMVQPATITAMVGGSVTIDTVELMPDVTALLAGE